MYVHLVFITRYRRNVLSKLAIRDLTAIFSGVCRDFGAELKECGGEDDHVHLMVIYPPKVTVSKLVNRLKGVSSRLLREHRPEISGRYKTASCGRRPISLAHVAAHRCPL